MSDQQHKKGRLWEVVVLGAIAAAGYYFFASKKARENRQKAARWTVSFKQEVQKQLESAKEINRESISDAVDRAVAIFERMKAVDMAELVKTAKEIKDNWKEFGGEVAKESTRSVRVLYRGIKRAFKQSGDKQ